MGMEIADEDFELDEINISAVCEVMNQMMGASATASISSLLKQSEFILTLLSFRENHPFFYLPISKAFCAISFMPKDGCTAGSSGYFFSYQI